MTAVYLRGEAKLPEVLDVDLGDRLAEVQPRTLHQCSEGKWVRCIHTGMESRF